MIDKTQKQRIMLSQEEFGNDVFLDYLLNRVKDIPSGGNLILDVSNFQWANDFQLSSLPFIASYLQIKRNIGVTIEYPQENLFKKDVFFNYLYSSGFFDFLKNYGIRVNKGGVRLEDYSTTDNLIKFQSFKNIAIKKEKGELNESRRFLYELSTNLRAIFQTEIFDQTTTAEKLARIIAKELIENINQHSGADLALVRCKYISNFQEIMTNYGSADEVKSYLKNHQNSNLFILTISDNGRGIINTLKEKYKKGDFLFKKELEGKIDAFSQSNAWWLRKAFEIHKTSEADIRSRQGLNYVLDTICEYNGFLYMRCDDAKVSYSKFKGTTDNLESTSFFTECSGTHYLIILPAEHRKRIAFSDCILYRKEGISSVTDARALNYEEVDISYKSKDTAISSSTEVSYKYPKEMVKILSERIDTIMHHSDRILAIDFSDAIHEKANDYAFIIEKLVENYHGRIGKFCILRNVDDEIIANFKRSKLSKLLKDYNSCIAVFNTSDRFSLLGIHDPEIEHELINLFDNLFLKTSDLSPKTINLIKNNQSILKINTSSSYGEIAYYVDFDFIFTNDFNSKISEEILRTGAEIKGHFYLNENIHVDNYLIAPLLFQNPYICRMYAKEIVKLFPSNQPDVLLTYSTTGILMYWYLKNYHSRWRNLKLTLVKSQFDLNLMYGDDIEEGQKVLILVDIKATGKFIDKLRNMAIEKSGSPNNIIGNVAIFDINNEFKNSEYEIKSLYSGLQLQLNGSDVCHCKSTEKKSFPSSGFILKIESSSGVPTIYQKEMSTLSVSKEKRKLLKTMKEKPETKVEHKDFRSRIDDDKLTEFELFRYWKHLENAFQIGHVKRGTTHFKHYDIPERLLFKDITLMELEAYIKQYTWSFTKEVHFIIYPKDLTAALLAHIVASRFLKKPTVIEARKYNDGSIVLPNNITKELGNKHVLLVDDAINTGATMLELIGLVNIYGGIVSGIFTITNRTAPEIEMTLRNLVPKVASAYRFHLDVLKEKDCDMCSYYQMLDQEMKSAAATKIFFKYIESKCDFYRVKPHESK